MGAIFLSAGVPDPQRGPEYARTADVVAIATAVSSLVHVILGRRKLIWGGHPAITPMIQVIADQYDVDYGQWVILYQSKHFADEYPEDNKKFRNIIEVDRHPAGLEASLDTMRVRMLSDHDFDAAVFAGGMKGIVDEFFLFRKFQPRAATIPLASTGGAAMVVANEIARDDKALWRDLNYVPLLHERLRIPVQERRFKTPDQQPLDPVKRW